MQKKQIENIENENKELEKAIIEYYMIQKEIKRKEEKQIELKNAIINLMQKAQLIKKETIVHTGYEDADIKPIICTLYSPVSIDYNLEAVKKDFPTFVEKDTKLSLSTPESIAAFKLKLKKLGLNKSQFKEIVDLMDVCKIEKVNQTLIQQEYDKGNIEDISKYASIKEKTKYIKVYEK